MLLSQAVARAFMLDFLCNVLQLRVCMQTDPFPRSYRRTFLIPFALLFPDLDIFARFSHLYRTFQTHLFQVDQLFEARKIQIARKSRE